MRVSLLLVARHRFIGRLVTLVLRLPVTGPRLRGIDELHELKYRVRARGNVDRAVDGTTDEQTGEAAGAIFIKHESLCKRNGKHSAFSMQASAGQERHWAARTGRFCVQRPQKRSTASLCAPDR